jgi:RecB family endonuclease NucS
VGKAKIVAEDQLKRVTLALAKDREEIKLRN